MPTGAAALGVAGVLIGVLIGATGIGGVLLVPFLVHGLKYPVQSAVAVALWSYLWSGLLAIALYWRRGSISARPALWLCGASLPGAFLGSAALAVVPGKVVEALIGGVLLLGGLQTLRPPREHAERLPPGPVLLVGLGLLTGFASALLGAGGAFLLVPLLVALGEPVLLAVGLGQAIQVPISAVATVANLRAGRIDLVYRLHPRGDARCGHRARDAPCARRLAAHAAVAGGGRDAGGGRGDDRASREAVLTMHRTG